MDPPERPADGSEPTTSIAEPRCPRCGGRAMAPRRVRRGNPFLSKIDPRARVCEDCGLDFEVEAGAPVPPSEDVPW